MLLISFFFSEEFLFIIYFLLNQNGKSWMYENVEEKSVSVESREKRITSTGESMRVLRIEKEFSAYMRLLTEFQNKYVHEIPEAEITLSLLNR